jgi:dipeptide/tripeptide permease
MNDAKPSNESPDDKTPDDKTNREDEKTEVLSLPALGLRVTQNSLIREKKGKRVADWSFEHMSSINIGSTINPLAIGLLGSACGFLYLRWALGLGTLASVFLVLVVGLIALFGLISLKAPVLRFEYQANKQIRLVCDDSIEEVTALVMSIQKRKQQHAVEKNLSADQPNEL